MGIDGEEQMKYLIATVCGNPIAILANSILETSRVLPTTRVPKSSNYCRGVANFRGKIITIIDLRVMMGQESNIAIIRNLIQTLKDREQDHLNWLANLKKSVEEGTEFTGQLDPHKCAFGLWYDKFRSDDSFIMQVMREFDRPHKAIHAVGQKVMDLVKENRIDEAHAEIESTRDTVLSSLINTFAEARETITERDREILVILKRDHELLAITVDSARNFIDLSEDDLQTDALDSLSFGNDGTMNIIKATAAWKNGEEESVLSIINPDIFFQDQN